MRRRRIHALGWRETRSRQAPSPDFPDAAGLLMIDQGVERVDGLVAAEQVDVDGDMLVGEHAAKRRGGTLPAVEEHEPASPERVGMLVADHLVGDPLLGQDQLEPRRRLPEQERQGGQHRAIDVRHGDLPGPTPPRVS